MNIAFLINQTHKEENGFTTTLLAFNALQSGHTIIYIGLADFVYVDDKNIEAHVRIIEPNSQIASKEEMLAKLRSAAKVRYHMQDIDVLWLRFDPVLDMYNRPWAASMGLQFAQLIKRMGRLVINDPDQLIQASNKLYLENFPKVVRPKTLVTRFYSDVVNFMDSQNDRIILKPVKGSGGKNVFLITPEERHNLKQTVDVIARDGYVIAQEYLPEATKGDLRFFLLDGQPIMLDGAYAAVQRVQKEGEIRSNIHQGAKAVKAAIDPKILHLVEQVSAKIQADGMYLVGLDIVGDKIMEINVFSPGALGLAGDLTGKDFVGHVIRHLEAKVKAFYS
ncbi:MULTISPECIES: glutathione synthase [Sphingobacterium]|uniref:glutathione synthase n=1 Tax=Sphingobacterium TaxID=28453 RepID=UPI0013DC265C|nr:MULTISPECIES: glutathione synthase [unclassified Sphingobacterium]